MTKFEKETKYRLYVFVKKKNKKKTKKQTKKQLTRRYARLYIMFTYTGMTCQLSYYTVQLQASRVNCPIGAQIGLW